MLHVLEIKIICFLQCRRMDGWKDCRGALLDSEAAEDRDEYYTGKKYSRVAEQYYWTHAQPAGLSFEMNLFQNEAGSIDYHALGLVFKLSHISRFATHKSKTGQCRNKLVFNISVFISTKDSGGFIL